MTIYGYQGEPYARVLADGTAEQNARSPATYLNQSFYGDINVPPQANAKAPPQWQVIDRTGQFEWHDHRIHYMSPAIPPQVKDQGKRTLIFDWKVPISVGAQPGRDRRASSSGRRRAPSAPVAVIVDRRRDRARRAWLLVLVVRRRRARRSRRAGRTGPGAAPAARRGLVSR